MARVPISTGSIPRPTLKTLLIVYGGAALTEDRITTDLLGENGGGAERDRTADLRSAIAALSHLSYSPVPGCGPFRRAHAGLSIPEILLLCVRVTRARGAGPRGHRSRA